MQRVCKCIAYVYVPFVPAVQMCVTLSEIQDLFTSIVSALSADKE